MTRHTTLPPLEAAATSKHFLGMPAARFLRDYWQKRPLLIRRAFADFRAPLTAEDLAGLACEETALSRLIRYDRRNDAWTVRQGPFAESEFPGLPLSDWTLLVQDVDKWDPDVAALLPHFAFLPRWRIDDVMVSFAATGGSVGAHVDQYDVFLLQGPGRRRWQIDAGANPTRAFRDDVELKLLREFNPTHEWVLEPGDMLYLPPGVPHHGVALDPCLTFSVGMRAPSQAEMLVDFAEYVAECLPEEARYTDPDLAPVKADGEIDAAALQRVVAALPWVRVAGDDREGMRESSDRGFARDEAGSGRSVDRFDRGDESGARGVDGLGREFGASVLRTWFPRFITRYRSAGEIVAPPRAPGPAQIGSRLSAGAMLHPHPFARIAWLRHGRGAQLFVDGQGFHCSLATARRVGGGAALDAAAYAALDDAGRALVHDWCARGYLLLSRAPRRRA